MNREQALKLAEDLQLAQALDFVEPKVMDLILIERVNMLWGLLKAHSATQHQIDDFVHLTRCYTLTQTPAEFRVSELTRSGVVSTYVNTNDFRS